MPSPSPYELRAIQEIHAWKNPEVGWFGYALQRANEAVDAVGDVVMKIPGVEFAIEKTFAGLLHLANDAAMWSVDVDGIRAYYGGRMIQDLDLEEVDRTIGYLAFKYKAAAFVEGAAAGGTGTMGPAAALAAMPVDVAALVTLNLRAVGEYATYCGFDGASNRRGCSP